MNIQERYATYKESRETANDSYAELCKMIVKYADGNDFTEIMQAIAEYGCKLEEVGMNWIKHLHMIDD